MGAGSASCHLSLETYSPAQPVSTTPPPVCGTALLYTTENRRPVWVQAVLLFQIIRIMETRPIQWCSTGLGERGWGSGSLNLVPSFEWVQNGRLTIVLMCWFGRSFENSTPPLAATPHAFYCQQALFISGVSSIFKFHFWFHSKCIPCDGGAHLKQSDKMKISRQLFFLFFLLEHSSATARWIFVCGEKRGSGFPLNPWGGHKAPLYINRHNDLLVWQLTKTTSLKENGLPITLRFCPVSCRPHTQLKSFWPR